MPLAIVGSIAIHWRFQKIAANAGYDKAVLSLFTLRPDVLSDRMDHFIDRREGYRELWVEMLVNYSLLFFVVGGWAIFANS